MENIKSKIFAGVAAVVFILICIIGYRAIFVDSTHYYTQIGNSTVKQLKNDEYEYNLTAYDEHGKMTKVTFKTRKELREDAYLELDIMFLRGVVNWREIQLDELPLDVKHRYAAE